MPTALITGPTAGIGHAFARHYAGRGHDLVLVSRDQSRLQETSERLTADHRVPVEILPADLSTRQGTDLVAQRLSDPRRAVDVLVNNAGFGVNKPFAQSTVEEEQRLLDVLVVAVMRLTHTALQAMLERARGDIINVSSTAGFTSRGSYSAHKAWVTSFTRALSFTYGADGIRIMALCPGFVRTEFHQRMGASMERMPDWMWLQADQVVAAATRDIARGKAVSIPTRRYQAIAGLARLGPSGLVARAAEFGR
jgi:short-subunit dehydrogenase